MKGNVGNKLLIGLAAMGVCGLLAAAEPAYVDAVDYPGNAEGWEAFRQLERRLDHDFDQICGDSFCEGDYSDYQPLRYRCSVHRATGVLRQCTWTFAASEIGVEPTTGRLLVDTKTWRCPTPLAAGTRLEAFYQALSVPNPLFEPLPGTGKAIYESLIGCL